MQQVRKIGGISSRAVSPQQQNWGRFDLRSVQLLSRVRLFATPWTAARQASLSFTISRSLLKLLSVMPLT